MAQEVGRRQSNRRQRSDDYEAQRPRKSATAPGGLVEGPRPGERPRMDQLEMCHTEQAGTVKWIARHLNLEPCIHVGESPESHTGAMVQSATVNEFLERFCTSDQNQYQNGLTR